jgi:hypothetical protein
MKNLLTLSLIVVLISSMSLANEATHQTATQSHMDDSILQSLESKISSIGDVANAAYYLGKKIESFSSLTCQRTKEKRANKVTIFNDLKQGIRVSARWFVTGKVSTDG